MSLEFAVVVVVIEIALAVLVTVVADAPRLPLPDSRPLAPCARLHGSRVVTFAIVILPQLMSDTIYLECDFPTTP